MTLIEKNMDILRLRIRSLMRSGRHIRALRLFRDSTGCGTVIGLRMVRRIFSEMN